MMLLMMCVSGAATPPNQIPFVIPPGGVVASDGSGGDDAKDPRIRRCTWAVVVLDGDSRMFFWAGGPFGGIGPRVKAF